MKRWKQYFQNLLTTESDETPEDTSTTDIATQTSETEISENELRRVLTTLKNGKATGADNTSTEMFKHLDEYGVIYYYSY